MKAFLINPPTGLYVREDRCQSCVGDFSVSVVRPPMDLMMMASSLEKDNVICKIKDYPIEGGDWGTLKKDFQDFNPDVLILSITTPTLKDDITSCKIAKEINPKVLTVVKGAHFLEYDSIALGEFPQLDIIIRGECDTVIKEIVTQGDLSLVKGITYRLSNGEIQRNEDRPLLDDLDRLPIPSRHLIRNELYTRPDTREPMAIIETSRGCPCGCIFCLVGQVAGKKIRSRSVSSIVDEIRECVTKYNICNFHFKSDTFTWDKDWVIGLCKEIIGTKLKIHWICNSRVDTLDSERIEWMKEAGCWAIGLGVESGNQQILNQIKKGITLAQSRGAVNLCREFGIKTYAYFMIGFPWDNENTINDSINFAIEINPDFVDFFMPYPFPGTELERITKEYGFVDTIKTGRAYSEPIINTIFLPRDELLRLKKKALKKFYLRPAYIVRTLFRTKSPRLFCNYFCHGIKTLFKIY